MSNSKSKFPRQSGLLMHPTSLPGSHGIGSLGAEARSFVDFLQQAGARIWQILPLGPTGYGDSPYQCFSSYAGNPYLIDLEELVEIGWLRTSDLSGYEWPDDRVDFGRLIPFKMAALRTAFGRSSIEQDPSFRRFTEMNYFWLDDYALFMALKQVHGGHSWLTWSEELRRRNPAVLSDYASKLSGEVNFQKFIQFLFFKQWRALKAYANEKGISFLGDLPLYVALDSADVWSDPSNFMLDEDLLPTVVAGVPPDYFSATGQLWGNPIYDWNLMRSNGFRWWIGRVNANLDLYDILRIDHFRGLEAYWAVPYGEDTAINGKWLKAPGLELLDALHQHFVNMPIVAEDLGVITDEVNAMREAHQLPGMKILQFAFDSSEGNNHSPHYYEINSVVYTGTHDNDTLMGWVEKANDKDVQSLLAYLGVDDAHEISWKVIRLAYSSVSCLAIVPVQDILGLGSSARMNLPGTTGGNWQWRLKPGQLNPVHAKRLAELARIYDR